MAGGEKDTVGLQSFCTAYWYIRHALQNEFPGLCAMSQAAE